MAPLELGATGLAAPISRALSAFLPGAHRAAAADVRAREARAEQLRNEAMRAMRDALDAADAARRVREEFLARMNHELRTPLNAVIGFSHVLEKNLAGNQRPEDIELLGRVRENGERLLRLIEGVLDQAVLQGGQLPVDLGETDVAAIAGAVVREFEPRANAKGIRLHRVIPAEACMARVDASRFEQVVYHIVDNAVKFTAAGEVNVIVVTDAARPVRLVVSDTGIGIPAHQQAQVFSPFEQGDASLRRSYDGAGLGLPLARQLCDAMGCSLTVESELGAGSRFSIRLP